MAIQSNINSYYEEHIAHIAEMILSDVKDGADFDEAYNRNLDNGLMYYTDQAYIVARAIQNGFVRWGENSEEMWQDIEEMVRSDIMEEYEGQKECADPFEHD